jgi:hypothetical protein
MASLAWEEVGKWILFFLLIIALIIIIALMFGGATGVWDRIRSVLTLGAG